MVQLGLSEMSPADRAVSVDASGRVLSQGCLLRLSVFLTCAAAHGAGFVESECIDGID